MVFSSDVLSTFKSVPQLPKSSTLLRLKRNSSDQNIFSFIFQGCQDVVLQTLSMLPRGFSLHGRRAQALAVALKQLYLLISPHVVLGPCTTILIILFPVLLVILQGTPGCDPIYGKIIIIIK